MPIDLPEASPEHVIAVVDFVVMKPNADAPACVLLTSRYGPLRCSGMAHLFGGCRGRGQVGKLEGSNGPRRVVQSLWSGAAAAVHRLACPRPVSGPVESNDCVPVAGVVGLHAVIITMRRSPAGGQPKPPARRSVDMLLRDLHADKRLHNRHIAVVPRSAPHILDTRR